ncbi:TPA: transcriptional regulator [Escherichia coli]|nr:helix-turn-helix domain-containing protein [Escherichia coli]MCV1459916.1 helix-turn-helix domain-containing protein [Escherichia coli]
MTKPLNAFMSAWGKSPADATKKKGTTTHLNAHRETTQIATVSYVLLTACRHLKVSRRQFAKGSGLSHTTVNRLLRGEVKITPEIALKLEYYTGVDAAFCLALQLQEMRETTDYGTAIQSSLDWRESVERLVTVSQHNQQGRQ